MINDVQANISSRNYVMAKWLSLPFNSTVSHLGVPRVVASFLDWY